MEGDRNPFQLGLAMMRSLSITLCHHLVFAEKKKIAECISVMLTALIEETSSCLLDLKHNLSGIYGNSRNVCIYSTVL